MNTSYLACKSPFSIEKRPINGKYRKKLGCIKESSYICSRKDMKMYIMN